MNDQMGMLLHYLRNGHSEGQQQEVPKKCVSLKTSSFLQFVSFLVSFTKKINEEGAMGTSTFHINQRGLGYLFFLLINCEWALIVSVKIWSTWQKTKVSHTQWCSLSLATVPGTESAPAHEMVAEMVSPSFFAVDKRVWVHTSLLLLFFWHLVLPHWKPQQHGNQAVSHRFAFLMKLYSNKIPYACRKWMLLLLGLQFKPSEVCMYFCDAPGFSCGWVSAVSPYISPICIREM